MGGTGKTPAVRWIARWLRDRGIRVSLISRGYGAHDGARNDEALELEEHLPDVPHLQDPDRVRAAKIAIEELDTQLILLDDAFQHRRIARDLDIVLIDALEPFGYGHVFPRGMLREPISGLSRADLIVLSRADQVEASQREAIRRKIIQYNSDAAWIEMAHAPSRLCSASQRELPVDALANQPVAAFCGIGNPDGFRRSLENCGYRLHDFREFPDHHAYTRPDLEQLVAWASAMNDNTAIVCTQKDLVKIGLERLGQKPLWALAIDAMILSGHTELERELQLLVNQIR
jgi:tetraacyldisaccharide 4'-kinase